MDKSIAEKIALFRYGIIAQVLHDHGDGQMKYFKQLTQKQLNNGYKEKKYSVSSFKEWLRKYRKGGINALYPSTRSDKGTSKKIDIQLHSSIQKMIDDYPYLSVAGIYRIMIKQGIITNLDFTEVTLRNYIRCNKLKGPQSAKTERKKYESPAVNILWVSDFMHGPYVTVEHNKKKKTYLCAIIDDHSRLIVGGRFFLAENTLVLASIFKEALLQYGLPKKFYCDNGAVFSSGYLTMACARIEVALIHSKPYDSPSRGKIERFFRTVRENFIAALPNQPHTLDQLNEQFLVWLKEYNNREHSSTKQSPLLRYMTSLNSTQITRLSAHELNQYFYNVLTRTVKNDSTISIDRQLFEVPSQFIGSIIEVRHPLDNPSDLTLYLDNQPFYQLKKVDLIQNADKPYTAIRFSNITKEEE